MGCSIPHNRFCAGLKKHEITFTKIRYVSKMVNSTKLQLNSVDEFEQEARRVLTPEIVNYIYGGTETGSTLERNRKAFSEYLLRRTVLRDIEKNVKTEISYFGGKIKSELPFFPSSINTSPVYPKAVLDILRVGKSFKVPIFVSDIAIADGLDASEIPSMVPADVPLIWQLYIFNENYDTIFKRAKQAQNFGYKAVVITVDADLNVKLGNEIPKEVRAKEFHITKISEVKKIRDSISLPFIVKGIMTPEDASVAVENGADGIVVSNHGGRILDSGQSSIEVLGKIVKQLRSKKSSRKTEVFFDSGIRRGTDILKALALGARGCLLGRPIFSGICVDHENGAERIMTILKEELTRAAFLCGIEDLSDVSSKILVEA
jgi:isopentenyl diphosphate isomerase/L-lactate dehydrogenase-like FMN-dependent dehydrogenase